MRWARCRWDGLQTGKGGAATKIANVGEGQGTLILDEDHAPECSRKPDPWVRHAAKDSMAFFLGIWRNQD